MSKARDSHAKEMEDDQRQHDIREQFVRFPDGVFEGLAAGNAARGVAFSLCAGDVDSAGAKGAGPFRTRGEWPDDRHDYAGLTKDIDPVHSPSIESCAGRMRPVLDLCQYRRPDVLRD